MPLFRRLAVIILLAAIASPGAVRPAEAAKAFPCVGERVVVVVDIPYDRQRSTEKIDIGYVFAGCFGEGRWVAVNGLGRYIDLDDEWKARLLGWAGLTELPPTPHRWDYPIEAMRVEVFTLIAAAGFGLYELIKFAWKQRSSRRERAAMT